MPELPGVYRMYGASGDVIYVGKAKKLANRLRSYFAAVSPSPKTRALVAAIRRIEYTVTPSESDALILEQSLIKEHQPRYNILLRDDKSYPLILVTDEEFPRILCHRGERKIRGRYYGPYPDASAVRESLEILRGIFPVRQCSSSEFSHRSRPCIRYQMGRCPGPCVFPRECGEEYRRNVERTEMFLKGRLSELLDTLTAEMIRHSDSCAFEQAARCRDMIASLRKVQERQTMEGGARGSLDAVTVSLCFGQAAVNVIFFRDDRILGSRNYFLRCGEESPGEIVRIFLEQYYLREPPFGIPGEILLRPDACPGEDFQAVLSGAAGQEITVSCPSRGPRAKLLEMGRVNADEALKSRMKSSMLQQERIEDLESLLGIPRGSVRRMECFDVSHTFGERTVASCVVFGRGGPETSLYRLFNITGVTPGDDFAAMHQALERRFLKAEDDTHFPDILFVDGGPGQLSQAEEIVTRARERFPGWQPLVIGVAKGEGRKPGLETLRFGFTRREVDARPDSPAFLLVLHIRDESHRFAITSHRRQRSARRVVSRLEQIPGVGQRKRQELLNRFGGLREITGAGRDEIAKVPGIGPKLAQVIYDWLHNTGPARPEVPGRDRTGDGVPGYGGGK